MFFPLVSSHRRIEVLEEALELLRIKIAGKSEGIDFIDEDFIRFRLRGKDMHIGVDGSGWSRATSPMRF
jgi:hypothetical protein